MQIGRLGLTAGTDDWDERLGRTARTDGWDGRMGRTAGMDGWDGRVFNLILASMLASMTLKTSNWLV